MKQEELKAFILSKITINKVFWEPKIEAFFKENSTVTRELIDSFFNEWIGTVREESSAFLQEYIKRRSIAIEEYLSDVEMKLFDKARRKKGLIPLEEVVLARDEVETALDEIGFKG